MSGDRDPTTNPAGDPGGMGASTGADPRGPAAGEDRQADQGGGEARSFAPTEPGHTSPIGDGGGTMSGRGQEYGADNPQAAAERNSGHGTSEPGQGGDHLMGRSGGQPQSPMEQHQGEDSGALSGTGSQGGAAAGGGRATTGPLPTGGGASAGAGGDMAASLDGMAGDAGSGANETSGSGGGASGGTGASAGGDAHLPGDGRKLGDPMDARRQTPTDGATGGLANGSGAD